MENLVGLGAFGAVAGLAMPASAQATYTIDNVTVDVTADNAVAAREEAITRAQRDGLRRLLVDLAPDTPADRLPNVDELAVARYVRSFEIASEQVGARRYVGALNVTYTGDAVRDLLGESGVTVEAAQPPTLIVPAIANGSALGLWFEAQSWGDALGAATGGGQRPRYVLPLGDAVDLATFSNADAAGADAAAAQRLAERYAAGPVVLAVLTPADPASGSTSAVELRGIAGRAAGARSTITPPPGAEDLGAVAAATLAALPELGLTRRLPAQSFNIVAVPGDVAGWVALRRQLGETPEVRGLKIRSFARNEVRLTLSFGGELPQLQEALAVQGLELLPEEGGWRLQRLGLAPPAAF